MDLDNSLRQLDEAVSTPGGFLIRSKHNRPRNVNSLYNNSRDFDVTVMPIEYRPMLGNETIGIDDSTVQRILDDTNFNNTTNNNSVLLSNNKDTTEALYNLFLEVLQAHSTESQIFDTVADLAQICSDALCSLNNEKSSDTNASDLDQIWLQNERNTWRLLYCLYQDRILPNRDSDMECDFGITVSEKSVVQRLYSVCPLLREYQLVVDWLEQNASEREDQQQLQHYTDRTVAWENTLHHLQNSGKSMFGSGRPIVSTLDPDAPIRERLPLHDLDIEDQKRLSKKVFTEVRSGRIEAAKVLCCHCGEPWRAAILEGWRLHHDPNYDPNIQNKNRENKEPIEGNRHRDIWKVCAWRMAEDPRMDTYSRATIGALGGHLDSLLGPCGNNWEDLLWAYLKVQIDIRVESEVRDNVIKPYVEMPEKYWNSKMTLEQVFGDLAASKNDKVRNQASQPDYLIQKYLILNDIPALMEEIEKWIENNSISQQLVRFLAHLVLFLKQIGSSHREDVCQKVLESYVQILIERGDPDHVAYYTSSLPSESQVHYYSLFLEQTSSSLTRRKCLAAAENAGLDIEEITTHTVQMIRNKQSPNEPQQQGMLSRSDLEKIEALDLLNYAVRQRGEALWQTNGIIRTFLAEGKLEGARQAFDKLPLDSIDIIISTHGGECNAPVREQSSMREYLCYKAYLDSQESFSDWFQQFHNARPVPPHSPKPDATFTERVAADHKAQQFQSDLDRWKITLQHQTETVKTILYNVLLFPDGWLADPTQLSAEANSHELRTQYEHRTIQMNSLRKLCIPKVVLLLHTVLHSTEAYKECMHLADLVSSEEKKLYEVYPKQALCELFTKLAESSLALLSEKKDAWGYPITV